jgi:hypothetical protein
MGRLPDTFASKQITQRIPYNMTGELVVAPSTSNAPFAGGAFLLNVDMPFEVHRMKAWVVGVSSATNVAPVVVPYQPPQEVLASLARINIARIGGTVKWMKTSTLLAALPKGTSEWTWELAEPDTIVRSEGYEVSMETLAMPVFPDGPLTNLWFTVKFEGYQLQVLSLIHI